MGKIIKDDVSIVISGEAGQGIQTIEKFLTRILKEEGFNVFATKEYMSRIRGGDNSTELRISSKKVRSYVDKIDILIPLTLSSIKHLKNRIDNKTIILIDKDSINYEGDNVVHIPIESDAKEIGNKIFSNTIAVGIILGLFGLQKNSIKEYMEKLFSKKSEEIINKNINAAEKGYEYGKNFYDENKIKIDIKKDEKVKNHILINGAEAVALGCIYGGCDSIFSYPMTPGTGVLLSLAEYSNDFDILVEQAEDEIAAINMAIGGWYAGARSMITTSGGGFALMTEGISLAGMIDSPVVAHIAQRPGPATGLPTRTAQEDLNLVLYAGHGEFERVIYAPGSLEEAFYLAKKSFETADKYQIPVFILTDQYFVDSYYNTEEFILEKDKITKNIVKTDIDYKRYKINDKPISPRGVPSFGEGIVVVDSDEHDEAGHITENLDLRVKLNERRLNKIKELRKNALLPELIGVNSYETLVISWGSNKNVVKEAVENIEHHKISQLHFNQLYPLPEKAKDYLKKAHKIICVENNATGQFAELIKKELDIKIENKILKYDGVVFSSEGLIEKIKELI